MTDPCHPACIDTPAPDDVRYRLDWLHPNRGQITETVCPEHLSLVRGAVTILGMGSIGELIEPGTPCTRCSNPHRTPRHFIAGHEPPAQVALQSAAGHRYMDEELT